MDSVFVTLGIPRSIGGDVGPLFVYCFPFQRATALRSRERAARVAVALCNLARVRVELEQSIIGTLLYKGLQRVKWLKIPLLHCILEHTPLVGGLCKRPLLSFVHNCSVS